MPQTNQSESKGQTSTTSKKTKNQTKKVSVKKKKTNERKSSISEKSWSTTSLREKIICSILCCCYFEDG